MKALLFVPLILFLPLHFSFAQGEGSMDSTLNNGSKNSDLYVVNDYQYKGRCDIQDVTFPDSLLVIGVSAFQGCRNLMDVVIPNGCEEVMDSAFYGCRSLRTIEIPASVSYVGRNAFPKSSVLIVKKKSMAERYAKKFGLTYAYRRGQQKYIGGKKVDDLTLDVSKDGSNGDASVIPIGQYRWRNDIKKVIFPDSLLSIGYCAFLPP